MPYYRIVIWTKQRRRPYSGIRFMESQNINAVQGMAFRKAEEIYRSNLVDVEVQMLPKTSTAVQAWLQLQQNSSVRGSH